MICVYCFTFPNLKKYVGVTSDFNRRMKQHVHEAKKEQPGMVVSWALKKYKLVNVKILGMFDNYDDANMFEIEMIRELGSIEFGYNVTSGGLGSSGYQRSEETKIKLSKSLKGNPKLMGRTPWNTGKPFTSEVRSKISKTLGSKPVLVFKDGEFIGEWSNLNQCAQDLNLYRGNITHCLKGKLKSTGGYKFEIKK